jgi:hypothetical protein
MKKMYVSTVLYETPNLHALFVGTTNGTIMVRDFSNMLLKYFQVFDTTSGKCVYSRTTECEFEISGMKIIDSLLLVTAHNILHVGHLKI